MVLYAKGCDVKDESTAGFQAVNIAKQADVALLFVGETHDMVGEAASRASLDLPGRQMELVQAIRHRKTNHCCIGEWPSAFDRMDRE